MAPQDAPLTPRPAPCGFDPDQRLACCARCRQKIALVGADREHPGQAWVMDEHGEWSFDGRVWKMAAEARRQRQLATKRVEDATIALKRHGPDGLRWHEKRRLEEDRERLKTNRFGRERFGSRRSHGPIGVPGMSLNAVVAPGHPVLVACPQCDAEHRFDAADLLAVLAPADLRG